MFLMLLKTLLTLKIKSRIILLLLYFLDIVLCLYIFLLYISYL
jgi:hypothetical protein